jgi:MFS transporter, FHS family, L-fucose permease
MELSPHKFCIDRLKKPVYNYLYTFNLITFLFLLVWPVHNCYTILIPNLKHAFTFSSASSTFIDAEVFAACFFMAVTICFIIKKLGYKIIIVFCLLFFAVKCILFTAVANTQAYSYFVFALFLLTRLFVYVNDGAKIFKIAIGCH